MFCTCGQDLRVGQARSWSDNTWHGRSNEAYEGDDKSNKIKGQRKDRIRSLAFDLAVEHVG